jgi:hypothetical protein
MSNFKHISNIIILVCLFNKVLKYNEKKNICIKKILILLIIKLQSDSNNNKNRPHGTHTHMVHK